MRARMRSGEQPSYELSTNDIITAKPRITFGDEHLKKELQNITSNISISAEKGRISWSDEKPLESFKGNVGRIRSISRPHGNSPKRAFRQRSTLAESSSLNISRSRNTLTNSDNQNRKTGVPPALYGHSDPFGRSNETDTSILEEEEIEQKNKLLAANQTSLSGHRTSVPNWAEYSNYLHQEEKKTIQPTESFEDLGPTREHRNITNINTNINAYLSDERSSDVLRNNTTINQTQGIHHDVEHDSL
eukprot:UN23751